MHKMLIGGQWIHAKDGRSLPVNNPSDGQVFDSISRGGAHEIDLAVKAARAALSGPWGAMNLTDKGRLLVKILSRAFKFGLQSLQHAVAHIPIHKFLSLA